MTLHALGTINSADTNSTEHVGWEFSIDTENHTLDVSFYDWSTYPLEIRDSNGDLFDVFHIDESEIRQLEVIIDAYWACRTNPLIAAEIADQCKAVLGADHKGEADALRRMVNLLINNNGGQ